MDLATALRQWRRCFQRAREIGAALPDGTLLVHALEVSAAMLGRLDAQSAFRVASARSELRVDEQPTQENVWAYSQVLLAEAETLQLASAVVVPEGPKPQVKQLTSAPLKTASTTPSGGTCRFWGSEAGCRHGRSCKFAHPGLEDSKDRCWVCSAIGHSKQDCPTKASKPTEQPNSSVGGSNGGGAGKGGGKGKSKDKTNKDVKLDGTNDKQENGKSAAVNKAAASTNATTATAGDQGAKVEETGGSGRENASSTGGSSGDALLGEVAGILRSLRLHPPVLKVLQVKKLNGQSPTSIVSWMVVQLTA